MVDSDSGRAYASGQRLQSEDGEPGAKMRVSTEANVLETAGIISARKSTIKTSRKTFRMVIDGIYSDKIGSIVQEIAANAFDSHLRAKQDRPFFVHSPTALKPEFFVRDFGVGMTDKVMEEVYIVVGESDKDMTDDEVGMWGLGSKSPFAYSDQYFITCYDGETARHYGYGIAEDGVPTLYLMHTEDCDEARGVRVGFAVESKDFELFEKAVQKVAIGHNGTFETNVKLKTIGEEVFSGENWQCFKESSLGAYGNRWFARQGCILYPISGQQVKLPQESHGASLTYVLDCPIGTVKITTSREAIAYDDEVTAYLASRIEGVVAEIRNAVWEQVKDIESVTLFFQRIKEIKPSFIPDDFEHPLTGLTKPDVATSYPGLFFSSKLADYGRWEFATPGSLPLATFDAKAIIVVDDISPLLDPSRDRDQAPRAGAWLTKSELRRISRFTRAYLEANKLSGAMFFANVTWDEAFWKACFPQRVAKHITFDELRLAVPRRVVPPKIEQRQPIRGLALAKAAGEQKPVFEIDASNDDGVVTWVSSEQYRRQATALFKVGKKFEIAAIYIAAPGAQALVEEAGIKHMSEVIDAKLSTSGLTFADWYFAKDKLSDYSLGTYLKFLRTLLQHAPKSYDKLAAGKGEYSVIAGAIRRIVTAGVLESLTDDDKKAIDTLLLDDDGKSHKPDLPEDLLVFAPALKAIQDNHYYNPTCKWVSGLGDTIKEPAKLKRLVDALLALQKLIPPSEKFKA